MAKKKINRSAKDIAGNKKPLFIVWLDITDVLILSVLALGVGSTFNSNRENLELALIFLFMATFMYFFASSMARRKGKHGGFTRSLNGFVSGLLFLVAPCIFFYHWQYNGNFESGIMIVFIVAGILRISAVNNFANRNADADKYYYTGIPVFWSPVIVLVFYLLSFIIDTDTVNGMLSLTLIIFSFLMLYNKEFKYLHKPKSWGKPKSRL